MFDGEPWNQNYSILLVVQVNDVCEIVLSRPLPVWALSGNVTVTLRGAKPCNGGWAVAKCESLMGGKQVVYHPNNYGTYGYFWYL